MDRFIGEPGVAAAAAVVALTSKPINYS